MQETILFYNFENTEYGMIMETILSQLQITVKHIKDTEILESIGYLLDLPNFEINDLPGQDEKIEKQMMVFHEFSDEQVELVLDIFKNAGIPYIPLKAVTTPSNIEWSFYKLYTQVEEEYESVVKNKDLMTCQN